MKGSRAKGRGGLEKTFGFCALLATPFFLPPKASWTTRGTMFCCYERNGAYGVNYSPI